MPSYNLYASEKKNPELVEALNKLKAQGMFAEFVIESCEVNLPLFLDRKIAENKTQAEWFAKLKEEHSSAKESVIKKHNDLKMEYLERVPRDRTQAALLQWLTGPANIEEWKAAGFKTAYEVVQALKDMEEK